MSDTTSNILSALRTQLGNIIAGATDAPQAGSTLTGYTDAPSFEAAAGVSLDNISRKLGETPLDLRFKEAAFRGPQVCHVCVLQVGGTYYFVGRVT